MNTQEYIERLSKNLETPLIGKEYENYIQEVIGRLGVDFCQEAGQLMNLRQSEQKNMDTIVISIFNDQNEKWRKVSNHFDWLPKNGFLNIVSHVFSDVQLLSLWVQFKLQENIN